MNVHPIYRAVVFLLLLFYGSTSYTAYDPILPTIAISSSSVIVKSLAKTDVALAKMRLNTNDIKGVFGESVANQITKNALGKDWIAIEPCTGRQGLDHVYIKTDKNGLPRGLMVAETKYNKSQLANTLDGKQMSPEWQRPRLQKLANTYKSVNRQTNIKVQKIPSGNVEKATIQLKNNKTVHFWRNNHNEPWKFGGDPADLGSAVKRAGTYGTFLEKGALGEITIRNRVHRIIPVEAAQGKKVYSNIIKNKSLGKNDIIIEITDPSNRNAKSRFMPLKNILNQKVTGATKKENIKQLEKIGYSREEAKTLAKNLTNKDVLTPYKTKDFLVQSAKNVGIAVVIGVVIDSAMQFSSTRRVDVKHLTLSGMGAGAGVAGSQGIHYGLTMTKIGQNTMTKLSGALRCTNTVLSSSLSALGAGLIISALLSYGSYFMGYTDLRTAHRSMTAGVVSSVASIGVLALAGYTGVTGTLATVITTVGAISGITPILAAGAKAIGVSTTGGPLVAAGTTIVITISIVAMYSVGKYFAYQDAKLESARVDMLLERYSDPSILNTIVNSYYSKKY